jgi:hypothetical protein
VEALENWCVTVPSFFRARSELRRDKRQLATAVDTVQLTLTTRTAQCEAMSKLQAVSGEQLEDMRGKLAAVHGLRPSSLISSEQQRADSILTFFVLLCSGTDCRAPCTHLCHRRGAAIDGRQQARSKRVSDLSRLLVRHLPTSYFASALSCFLSRSNAETALERARSQVTELTQRESTLRRESAAHQQKLEAVQSQLTELQQKLR